MISLGCFPGVVRYPGDMAVIVPGTERPPGAIPGAHGQDHSWPPSLPLNADPAPGMCQSLHPSGC